MCGLADHLSRPARWQLLRRQNPARRARHTCPCARGQRRWTLTHLPTYPLTHSLTSGRSTAQALASCMWLTVCAREAEREHARVICGEVHRGFLERTRQGDGHADHHAATTRLNGRLHTMRVWRWNQPHKHPSHLPTPPRRAGPVRAGVSRHPTTACNSADTRPSLPLTNNAHTVTMGNATGWQLRMAQDDHAFLRLNHVPKAQMAVDSFCRHAKLLLSWKRTHAHIRIQHGYAYMHTY